jgi:hypothetical protein
MRPRATQVVGLTTRNRHLQTTKVKRSSRRRKPHYSAAEAGVAEMLGLKKH